MDHVQYALSKTPTIIARNYKQNIVEILDAKRPIPQQAQAPPPPIRALFSSRVAGSITAVPPVDQQAPSHTLSHPPGSIIGPRYYVGLENIVFHNLPIKPKK